MDSQHVFQRWEQKYLLSAAQYHAFIKGLGNHMQPDCYGRDTVNNIYFDTPDFLLIRRSLEKPCVYKEKLRLRCYGTPRPDSPAYIEVKKKYDGIVYKRRISMPLRAAEGFLYDGIRTLQTEQEQIAKEILWFLRFYKTLEPKMAILYTRTAYIGSTDPLLRLTFDENIRWRQTDLRLTAAPAGSPLLEEGQRLMEVKLPSAMPLWMAALLSDLQIYPVSYSKYGNAYKEYLQHQGGTLYYA